MQNIISGEKPVIYNNYSIGEILEKYDSGICTEEILYLKETIEEYREVSEKKILESFRQIASFDRQNAMKWIELNVEEELKAYVRMAFLGKYNDGDVLKRNPGRYKTISNIGVIVEEPDRSSKLEELMEYWRKQGEQVRAALKLDRERQEKVSESSEPIYRETSSLSEKSESRDDSLKEKELPGEYCGIFETHAHYYLEQYKGCADELLWLLHSFKIEHIVIPAIEYASNFKMKEMFEGKGFDFVHLAYGTCHPKYLWKEIDEWDADRWNEFRTLVQECRPVAIGEMGLDYSYEEFNEAHRDFQRAFFIQSIEEANKTGLPAILHIRPADFIYGCSFDADRDAVEILREHPIEKGAVAHCFGGNPDTMRTYLDAGVRYFGIGGRVTYGEQGLIEAVRVMPLESLLLETDSPYIRVNGDSRPNTSLSIYDIAQKIAEIKGCSTEQILKAGYENGCRFFRIKKDLDSL